MLEKNLKPGTRRPINFEFQMSFALSGTEQQQLNGLKEHLNVTGSELMRALIRQEYKDQFEEIK